MIDPKKLPPAGNPFLAVQRNVIYCVEAIDTLFGAGYAKGHPELIRVYLESLCAERITEDICRKLTDLGEMIGGPLVRLAESTYEVASSISSLEGQNDQ